MTFISYAQNFEDVMLWRALKRFTPGRYIDIGAQDPVVDSVSKAFHEAGWHGVHVEPSAHYAAALRKAFPEDNVIEAVVAAKAGTISFYEMPGGGLSTARKDIAQFHCEHAGHIAIERKVPATTLNKILSELEEPIHWLKVDVEGLEREVFEGWGDAPQRPWIIVVEATFPTNDTPTHEEWENLITAKNYDLVYTDGLNRFYLHSDQAALQESFRFPPNVFDDFELSGTATSLTFGLIRRFETALTEQSAIIEMLGSVRDSLKIALDARIELSEKTKAELIIAEEDFAHITSQITAEKVAAEIRVSDVTRQLAAEKAATEIRVADFMDQIKAEKVRMETRIADIIRQLDVQERIAADWKLKHDLQLQAAVQARYVLRISTDLGQAARNEASQLAREANDRVKYIADLRNALASESGENAKLNALLSRAASTFWVRLLTRLHLIHIEAGEISPRSAAVSQLLNEIPSSFELREQLDNYEDRHLMAEFAPKHVNELLLLNGAEFVDQIYRIFLRRSVDQAGGQHYLNRLWDGDSKETVLLAIADSPEGRALPCPLIGVDKLRDRHARKQRFWNARNRQLERSINRIEFSLSNGQTRTATRIDSILDRLVSIEASLSMRISSNAYSGHDLHAGAPGVNSTAIFRKSVKDTISEVSASDPAQFIEQLRGAVQQSSEAMVLANLVC